MFGNNPIRTPLKNDGRTLEVKNIFLTVQGEGPNTGQQAVFVRLGGCNLACSFCDTEFEEFSSLSVDSIITQVNTLSQDKASLVVITGGEPFRQPIEMLVQLLLQAGFRVQIETNGTLYRPLPDGVEIICSPKNIGVGYQPIRPDLLAKTNALKFIVSASNAHYNHAVVWGRDIPVYLQPMDEYDANKNRQNMYYAMLLAAQNGFRLSLQTHKIAGLE